MQRHFEVTPPSVDQMVVTLEKKGLITRVAGKARSITVQISPAAPLTLERKRQSVQIASDSATERIEHYREILEDVGGWNISDVGHHSRPCTMNCRA